jgi:uncharacterized protein
LRLLAATLGNIRHLAPGTNAPRLEDVLLVDDRRTLQLTHRLTTDLETSPPHRPLPGALMDLRADREQLFGLLARPDTTAAFFERVTDDVVWTVEGTHPLAGHYTSRAVFVEATFGRLGRLMRDGTHLEVRHLVVDGSMAVAELRAGSTTIDGAPYDNTLCWVCRFDSAEPGASIVEVRAYLDSAMVAWTIMRNEALVAGAP